MFPIRIAEAADLEALSALDPLVPRDPRRLPFLERSVRAGSCYVGGSGPAQRIVAYAVLEYSFYSQGFVSMLYVHPDFRRQGWGSALMQRAEADCRTPKLFTSTNLSNLPMQALLASLSYTLAGVIHHLDENDPELVFLRRLRGDTP